MYPFDNQVKQYGMEGQNSFEGVMSLCFIPRALRKEEHMQESRKSVMCYCSKYGAV